MTRSNLNAPNTCQHARLLNSRQNSYGLTLWNYIYRLTEMLTDEEKTFSSTVVKRRNLLVLPAQRPRGVNL